jgi:hypothetical protein
MFNKEASTTNFIVFGLTQSGVEPTIYYTQGEHVNHCTTNEITCRKTNYLREISHTE